MINCKVFSGQRPRVIAHRGASAAAPENTLPAFELAAKAGADIIELDVRLTADNQVVVCHDAAVDRVTDGSGLVSELTYAQLQRLNAGYRFTPDGGRTYPFRRSGVYMPLLSEVLQRFPAMNFYIEMKDSNRRLPALLKAVLEKNGRLADGSVVVSTFSHAALKRWRRLGVPSVTGSSRVEMWQLLLAARVRLPLLFRGKGAALQMPVRKLGIACTSPAVVAMAHRLGLEVHTYTIDDAVEMRRFLRMGVDGIFTNRPALLRAIVDSRTW